MVTTDERANFPDILEPHRFEAPYKMRYMTSPGCTKFMCRLKVSALELFMGIHGSMSFR
jgi:hypothetical protein